MSDRYTFGVPPVVTLPVAGSKLRYPVRRIYCVARNYAAHAREMGADTPSEAPFFFGKPRDALVPEGGKLPYPKGTSDLQHEVELVAAVGRSTDNVDPRDAVSHIYGYAVGLDLTRRDLQRAAKERGQPWDAAKGFDASAPVSAIQPVSSVGHPSRGAITLHVNDSLRQSGDLSEQIWSCAELVAWLSKLVTLMPGDLIFTGTPAGVGPLRPGDRLLAKVQGVAELHAEIA